MSELVTVTLKMSAELRDRLKARAAEDDGSVSALLVAGAELVLVGSVIPGPDVSSSDQAAALSEIASLQKDVSRLKREFANKVGVPVPRVDAVATKTIGHHAAGPVYEPVPRNLSGEAVAFRPKAGWKSSAVKKGRGNAQDQAPGGEDA
jgi:hypothetical protein